MSDCEYELVVLKPEDFEEVVTFLDKHFVGREPLSAGMHTDGVDIRNREGRFSEEHRQALSSGVSLGARVKKNGELAGVRLSWIEKRDTCKDDLNPALELVQTQEDILTLLDMTWEGVDAFGEEQQILRMFILCVAEEHGQKGLAKKLVKETIRVGVAAGCNRSAVSITSRYSGSLYRKLGFETFKVLDLTKLGPKYKGRQLDFDNMNGNSTICAMIKQGLREEGN